MSEGVEVVTFESLIDRGVLETGDGYRAKLEELGGGGPLFLRAGCVTVNAIEWDRCERFRHGLDARLQAKIGRPGDTIITTKGNSIGRTAYVPEQAPSFVYSPHLSYWRSLNKSLLWPSYLRYWARSEEFCGQLRAMAHSTDMAPYLSLVDQRRLRIGLPPIATQRAIADVLGALDGKIALNNRLAACCEFLIVELVDLATDARRVALGNLVHIDREQIFPSSIEADWVTYHSIPAFDNRKTAEIVTASSIKSSKFVVRRPAVLVSKLNPSTARIWNISQLSAALSLASTEFLVLAPLDGYSCAELWAVCSRPEFIGALVRKATGTSNSHQRVRPDDLLATDVIDPKAIPDRARRLMAALSKRAESARQESFYLSQLRDALLPKLMSGEIRVRDAERAAEVAL